LQLQQKSPALIPIQLGMSNLNLHGDSKLSMPSPHRCSPSSRPPLQLRCLISKPSKAQSLSLTNSMTLTMCMWSARVAQAQGIFSGSLQRPLGHLRGRLSAQGARDSQGPLGQAFDGQSRLTSKRDPNNPLPRSQPVLWDGFSLQCP